MGKSDEYRHGGTGVNLLADAVAEASAPEHDPVAFSATMGVPFLFQAEAGVTKNNVMFFHIW
jgi:hypothetical protein